MSSNKSNISQLTKLAEAGDVHAQVELAIRLGIGDGIEASPTSGHSPGNWRRHRSLSHVCSQMVSDCGEAR